MAKDKKKKKREEDSYYERLKTELDVEKTEETEITEETIKRLKKKPTSVGRQDQQQEEDEDEERDEEEQDEKEEEEDKEEEKDQEEKDQKEDQEKDDSDLGEKAKDEAEDKAEDVGEKAVKKEAKDAAKAAKGGKEAAKAGGLLSRAGGAIARGAGAAIAFIGEYAAIIGLVLLAVILIFGLIYLASNMGSTPTELPDEDLAADRQDVAEAVCWAGECDKAADEARKVAKGIDEEVEEESEETDSQTSFWQFARAQDKQELSREIKNLSTKTDRILTNFSALSAMGGRNRASLEMALDNHQLIKSTISDLNSSQSLADNEGLRDDLTLLSEYNQNILKALQAVNRGQKEPVLAINQYDLRLIKEFKIDIRLLRLLNELARRAQGENEGVGVNQVDEDELYQIIKSPKATRTKKIDELTKPSKKWSQIKVSRLTQFDPKSDEEAVTSESEATRSAHYGGKAADISVVGSYKCETKGFLGFGDKTKWYPAHVAYQTEYRPPGLNNYLNPNLNDLASVIRLPGNQRGHHNIDSALMESGLSQIAQELGIDPRYLINSRLDSPNLGSAHLEDGLGLPSGTINSIVAGSGSGELSVGSRYLEQILGLPGGSIEGSSQEDILKSIGLRVIREGLGLDYSNWQGDWSNYELGKAVVENAYRIDYSEDNLEKIINTNPNQFIRKTGIESLGGSNNETLSLVGQAYRTRVNNSQSLSGLSKSIGLPSDTISDLSSSKESSLLTAGLYHLSGALGIDPYNQESSQDISLDLLNSLISSGEISLPLGISKAQVQSIIANQDDQRREEGLENLGQDVIERIKDEQIDNLTREKLTELTGVDYYQVGAEDLKNLLTNKERLNEYIKLAGSSLEEELFYQYRPNFGNYQPTIYDYHSIKDGNWQDVVNRIGSSYVETELGLPGNSFMAIVDGGSNTDEAIARAGLALILERLGVDNTNSYGWFDEWEYDGPSKNIKLEVGQAIVESKGLTSGSFFGDMEEIIKQNGKERVAASFNISVEELDQIIETDEVPDQTVIDKLSWADSSLGLDRGLTYRLYQGEIKAEDYARRVAQAQLFGLSNKKLADLVGLDERPDIDVNIADLILNGNVDNNQLITGLSQLYDRYLGQELSWPKDLALSQITNDPESRDRALSAGMERLSLILTDGNRSQANVLSNLFDRSYIRGEEIGQDEYLEAGLSFVGVSGSTVTDRTVLTNLFNGNIDSAFDEINQEVIKDQTQQTLIGSWIDLRLDGAIGLTRAEIDAIEETYNGWEDGNVGDGRLISVLNSSFEVVDPAVVNVIEGDLDYLEMTEMFFDDEFQQFAGITVGQARQIRDIYQGFQNGNLEEGEFYTQLATSFGVDRDVVESARAAESIISGGEVGVGTIGYMAYQIGIGEEIDEATGIRGFSRGLIVGLVTQNWYELGVTVLSNLLGIGETKCQDPTEITREHIRELVGWTLRAEDLPLQIGVFREEDVNYYNGLSDEGEEDQDRPNLIYDKYGSLEERGNRGLFSNNHMWNHIHIGY